MVAFAPRRLLDGEKLEKRKASGTRIGLGDWGRWRATAEEDGQYSFAVAL
jgi:hypothetical protein